MPTLEKIRTEEATIQALVIAPTRELAVQSQEELFRFGRSKGVKVRSVYGGSSIEKQIKALKSGAHIVVGTPGRLLDLIKRKALKLDHIETLILDEADEMLNMGFLEDIEAIISRVPETRQTLLFSATMPEAIKRTHITPVNLTFSISAHARTAEWMCIKHAFFQAFWQDIFTKVMRCARCVHFSIKHFIEIFCIKDINPHGS